MQKRQMFEAFFSFFIWRIQFDRSEAIVGRSKEGARQLGQVEKRKRKENPLQGVGVGKLVGIKLLVL